MTAFTAIAWYNALELFTLLLLVFKKYSGLYFWSLLLTTISVVPYATGAWLQQNNVSSNSRRNEAILLSSWIIMVPGQSLVLYSRLHLISQNFLLLRFILYMIITNTVLLCIPTVVLDLGQYTDHPAMYTKGYEIMEKIQMTMFTTQEILISCIYLTEVYRVLKFALDGQTRKAMWRLIAMNVLHLILDLALLMLEYFDMHSVEKTLKSLVYSVKLKIEFAVLSQLARAVRNRNTSHAFRMDISKSGEVPSDDVQPNSEVTEIVQGNIPREWRVSVGVSEILSPRMRTNDRMEEQSPTFSLGSVDAMYPGRLG
ncbi:hypothetical protein N0V90_001923 [Kalmusia sp. IMI 367209]|nr:hypothetical protein N0V90_001923 [Kalmusia sp. IMI 367209]